MDHVNKEKPYINAFNIVPGIGPHKMHMLFNYFDSFTDAWTASKEELCAAGLSSELASTVTKLRKSIDVAVEWKKCTDQNISLITFYDDLFPSKLSKITNPPFSLYVRGNIDVLNKPSVTIVGSRAASAYALHATKTISQDIAMAGVGIISGLALGTDACAHSNALKANGTTIAVLGGGVDDHTITPRSHINLAHEILAHDGVIVSEYSCGTQPHRGTFPARNRLMAGLSDVVIVIEAAKRSGTLITAEWAEKFHKPLFALPGSIFSQNTHGPHALIKKNTAQILLSSDDVLTLFDKETKKIDQKLTFYDQNQEMIFAIIKKYPDGIHIDQLIKKMDMEAHEISSALTMLEINDHVINTGNQTYICAHV